MTKNRPTCRLLLTPVFLSALLIQSACSFETHALEIELVTGLVPGPEFAHVETTLFSADEGGRYSIAIVGDADARVNDDFVHGHSIATFDVGNSTYRVRVRLTRPDGTFLVDQTAQVTITDNYLLRVHITRDCVGVVCPGSGSPEFVACLGGRCVDPRCDVDHASFCPEITFCHATTECSTTSTCSTEVCIEGVCTEQPIAGTCAADQWCNPDTTPGCTSIDVTPPPVSVACDTVCFDESVACRFGYWDCSASTPTCDTLANRSAGTACGTGSVCDLSGSCVGCPDGLACTLGCATGTIDCSSGPPVCVLSTPIETLPAGTACRDVGACIAGSPCVTNGVCDASGACTLGGDTPGVVVEPSGALTTTEVGGSAMLSLRLAAAPTAPVTIAVTSTNTDEGNVSPTSLVFTNADWNDEHTLTVTGVDDLVADGARSYAIHFAISSADARYAALVIDDVAVSNIDNETAGITVTPTSGLVTSESATTATFQVQLNTMPTAAVLLSINSGNPSEGTALPFSLTFTPDDFDAPQTVVVTGEDDLIADGDRVYTIRTEAAVSADARYNGLDASDVSVLNTDNDTAGVIVTPSSGLVTDETGRQAFFDVVLTAAPTADVSILLMSTNVGEGTVTPAALTFDESNWNIAQTVTITGVDDAVYDEARSYSILTSVTMSADASYAGIPVTDVTVTNLDDDALFTQQHYIKASNTDSDDQFSYSVAMSSDGNTLAIGAPGESSNAVGVDGDQSNNALNWSGAVYIFTRSGSTWTQEAYLKASNPDANDYFGWSLDLSGDGNTLVVGAWNEASNATGIDGDESDNSLANAGAAYVFTRSGSTWSQQAYVKASNTGSADYFGFALALSENGNTLAIGSLGESSAATGIDGIQSDESEPYSGAVYVFERAGVIWTQEAYIKASNTAASAGFGVSVALSADGNTLAAGAYQEASSSTGINGDEHAMDAAGAGAAYVFTRSGASWSQEAYIKASNTGSGDVFGYALDLSADGNTLAVGSLNESSGATGIDGDESDDSAPSSGAVYVYVRAGTAWTQQAYVKASNTGAGDAFGYSVRLADNGDALLVGATGEASSSSGIDGDSSDNSLGSAGASYFFRRTGTTWEESAYIKSSSPTDSEGFGQAFAMSSDASMLVIGGNNEPSAAIGFDGDDSDESAWASGAAYLFLRN